MIGIIYGYFSGVCMFQTAATVFHITKYLRYRAGGAVGGFFNA
jgi:hypothetical protein